MPAPSPWSRSSPPPSARRRRSCVAPRGRLGRRRSGARTVGRARPRRRGSGPSASAAGAHAAARQRLRPGRGSTPAARRRRHDLRRTSPSGERAQGSGFVVSAEGHVLTNSHVVTNAGERRSRRPAARAASTSSSPTATGSRPRSSAGTSSTTPASSRSIPSDHAVSPVPLGDSSRVVVGEPVAAIGSPFGNENSLAVGVVSATERSIESLTSALRRLRTRSRSTRRSTTATPAGRCSTRAAA